LAVQKEHVEGEACYLRLHARRFCEEMIM
jgi:hypothetical protein